jgi:hypothetical protein
MNCDFYTASGWVFGLVSAAMAVLQYFKKENYRKQLKLIQTNKSGGVGYQAKTMTINTGTSHETK